MGKARERVFEERKELVDTIIRDLENGRLSHYHYILKTGNIKYPVLKKMSIKPNN